MRAGVGVASGAGATVLLVSYVLRERGGNSVTPTKAQAPRRAGVASGAPKTLARAGRPGATLGN